MNLESFFFISAVLKYVLLCFVKIWPKTGSKLEILEEEQNQNHTRSNQISKAHSEFQNKIEKNSVMDNKVECLQGYRTTCSTITVLSLLQEHISSWSSRPFLNHLRHLWPRMRRKTWKKHFSICNCLFLSSAPLLFPYTSSFYLKVFFVGRSNTDIIISEELPYHPPCTLHCWFLSFHLDDTA